MMSLVQVDFSRKTTIRCQRIVTETCPHPFRVDFLFHCRLHCLVAVVKKRVVFETCG